MKKTIILAAGAAALSSALAACASTATPPLEVNYTVIDDDVTIPFTHTIRNFRVAPDRSLLLDGPGRKWYRATIAQPCKSDLRWEETIALADRTSSSV